MYCLSPTAFVFSPPARAAGTVAVPDASCRRGTYFLRSPATDMTLNLRLNYPRSGQTRCLPLRETRCRSALELEQDRFRGYCPIWSKVDVYLSGLLPKR